MLDPRRRGAPPPSRLLAGAQNTSWRAPVPATCLPLALDAHEVWHQCNQRAVASRATYRGRPKFWPLDIRQRDTSAGKSDASRHLHDDSLVRRQSSIETLSDDAPPFGGQ
jgi:hypothetical protein